MPYVQWFLNLSITWGNSGSDPTLLKLGPLCFCPPDDSDILRIDKVTDW